MLSRLQFAFWGLILSAGCAPTVSIENDQLKTAGGADAAMTATETFRIDEAVGKSVVVDGLLEGNCILGESGEEFGVTHKGRSPLRIRHNSAPLALTPKSDEIARQLAAQAGHRVRLQGVIGSISVDGRRGAALGQAGYTGPIPYHVVYHSTVASCEELVPDAAVDERR